LLQTKTMCSFQKNQLENVIWPSRIRPPLGWPRIQTNLRLFTPDSFKEYLLKIINCVLHLAATVVIFYWVKTSQLGRVKKKRTMDVSRRSSLFTQVNQKYFYLIKSVLPWSFFNQIYFFRIQVIRKRELTSAADYVGETGRDGLCTAVLPTKSRDLCSG